MKLKMTPIAYSVLLVLAILLSCSDNKSDHSEKHSGKHQHANHHMNKTLFAELVERFESSERDEWQKPEEVIKFLGDLKNKTAIDIGAGTGYLEFKIRDTTVSLIAADVDERFIDYISNRINQSGTKNISVRKADYNFPPVNENEADLVYMVDVYHHIENRVDYFALIKKRLKAEGKLVIVDFKKGDFKHGPPDEMKLAPEEVIDELKQSGFTCINKDTTTLPFQYMLKFE